MNILQFPGELHIKILSYLGFCNQLKALQVCKAWSKIITNSQSIRTARYINEGCFQSKKSRLHQIFQRFDYSVFVLSIDLSSGEIEKWRWWRDPELWESVVDTERYLGSSNQDISRCPFLDDPVLDMDESESQKRPDLVGKWKKRKILVSSEPLIWDPERIKFEVSFYTKDDEIHLAEWELSDADFATPANSAKKPIMEALTVRSLCEAFAMKLKRQIEDRAFGPFGNNGLCACCDRRHWITWRGSKVDVMMEAARVDDDGALIIGVDVKNLYELGEERSHKYKIQYIIGSDEESYDEEEDWSDSEESEIQEEEQREGCDLAMEIEEEFVWKGKKRRFEIDEEQDELEITCGKAGEESVYQALRYIFNKYDYESDDEREDGRPKARKRRHKREENEQDETLEKLREIFARNANKMKIDSQSSSGGEEAKQKRRREIEEDEVDEEEDLRKLREMFLSANIGE